MLFRFHRLTILFCLPTLAALCAGAAAQTANIDATAWHVSKSSGNVWVMNAGVQPVSLTDQAQLKPGDSIRTGSNGRVLLERGKETVLLAPNSALTIPATQKDATSTTIIQQSGSIELTVEKRNVRSFEVETPFLVAAVKGTQFSVTVNKSNSSVQVFGGSVEVSDFKTGEYALVAPGQTAKVSAQGDGGLSLSGAGVLAPIEHGAPRPSPVPPLPVPSNGLSAPNDVPAGQRVHMLRLPNGNTHADATGGHHAHVPGAGRLHIGSPLGELKLDIHRVTHGLARGSDTARGNAAKLSVWSSGDINAGNGVAKNYNQGNNGSGSGTGSVSGATSGSGNAGGVASAGGNGNGNAGNSNGQDNGNGNGNANGNGANNTNGNGKKNGHNKG